jgi:putative glutamine amidotransferase
MQVLGTRAGAHLREVSGHVGRRHDVFGIIQGEKNSFHRFAIHHCPKGYEILAASPDGVIEAVKHVDLPWEGWMWHPEREPVFSEDDGKRLRDLLARVHETT